MPDKNEGKARVVRNAIQVMTGPHIILEVSRDAHRRVVDIFPFAGKVQPAEKGRGLDTDHPGFVQVTADGSVVAFFEPDELLVVPVQKGSL